MAAALLVLTVAVAVVVALRRRRAGEDEFAAVCTGIRFGETVPSVERAFLAIGERRSGTGGMAGAPPWSHHWFRRAGLSRHQQCTVHVDVDSQEVHDVELVVGTDFTYCTDPFLYPRRSRLCDLGDWLAL